MDFIARHEIGWELAFAGLAILYLVVGEAAESSPSATLASIEAFLTLIFALEFGTRIVASHDRRSYLRGHWIDLAALLPAVRGLRVARLLRLLRLVRAFAGVYRSVAHLDRMANHRGLAWLVSAWLAVMVICSLGLYAAENGVNEAVTSPLDAFWWGIVTLTTVGYGDVYPVTPEGRLAASALMLLGIGLFSIITATVTSYLVSSGSSDPGSSADRIREIAALRGEGLITDAEFASKKAELLNRM